MKVAVLSESAADEAAIGILVNALIGKETYSPTLPRLRSRGWPSVLNVLPTVLKHLHYRTDADALVVVADADESGLHTAAHTAPSVMASTCRRCALRDTIDRVSAELKPVSGRLPLRTAVGMAVPAIEAWYLAGCDPRVRETSFDPANPTHPPPYTKLQLKNIVYGTDRPSLPLETQRATEEARRLAVDLAALEDRFPGGFGSLAHDIRDW